MPNRDLHLRPFDAGTKIKLSIYRSYVRAWLQVFLHAKGFEKKPLQFFDFFCGPGEDSADEPGSPLILLSELTKERANIEQRGHAVRILFNDIDKKKIENLRILCLERKFSWRPRFESSDFNEVFDKVQKELGNGPSLVFIDQNGVKHITRAVFNRLTDVATTDFIFFTASSFKFRFRELVAPEIHFPENVSYLEVHRVLADKYREWAPKDMFIGHFSIRKERNIYGLVFGTHHWRGMQKFLEIAWSLDKECGEANYEMEGDTRQGLLLLPDGRTGFKKRKVEVFQEQLEGLVERGELMTDKAVFLHCLMNGFLPRIAKDVYVRLKDRGLLKNLRNTYPRYSDAAMKEPRNIEV